MSPAFHPQPVNFHDTPQVTLPNTPGLRRIPHSVHGKVGGLGHRDEAEPREEQRRSLRSCSPPAATELEAPEHPAAAATRHSNPAFQPQQCPGPQVTRQQQKWVLGPQPPAPETPMTLAPPTIHSQQQSRRTLQHRTWQRCLHQPSYPHPLLPPWFRRSRTRGKNPLSQVTRQRCQWHRQQQGTKNPGGTRSNKRARDHTPDGGWKVPTLPSR